MAKGKVAAARRVKDRYPGLRWSDKEWSPLRTLGDLDIHLLRTIEIDPDRNLALGRAFKALGLDPDKGRDWLVLCALLAEERFAERNPGQRRLEKWGEEQQWRLIYDYIAAMGVSGPPTNIYERMRRRKEFEGRYRGLASGTIRRRLHTVLKTNPWLARHLALMARAHRASGSRRDKLIEQLRAHRLEKPAAQE